MQRLLIYGDSNSFGTAPLAQLGEEAVHPPGVRWADVATGVLGADWDVVIEGLPGRTTVLDDPIEGAYRNGLTVMPAIIFSHRPIDVMVIALGTNDQKYRFGLAAQDVALGLARLAREALATGVVGQVLLVAPPALEERGSLAEMFAGAPVRCVGLALHVEQAAAREGVAFFDAGAVMSVDPLDGVHWAADAHQSLGRALAEKVKEIVA